MLQGAKESAPLVVGEPPQAPPRELRAALMPGIPAIVDAAVAAIGSRDGAGPASQAALERNLRLGLTDAVDRWFEPNRPSGEPDLHFSLGRAQARAGRSLDELMGFYRVAGQTMWRHVAELGTQLGARPEDLYRLAETGFGCVDEISTQAAAGFSEEQSHRSGASQSRRSEFVRLLLRDPQPPGEMLAAAAETAGVQLAPTLALFVGPGEMYEAFARSALDQAVLGPREEEFVGVLFDPEGADRRARLRAAAERAGARLALGPAVPLTAARHSLARARALLALMVAGLAGAEALGERRAARAGAAARRRPSSGGGVRGAAAGAAGDRRRGGHARQPRVDAARVAGAPGQRKAIAQELGVHPQTVRYRMSRLRELFGEALDEPDGRFELELALRMQPFAALTR